MLSEKEIKNVREFLNKSLNPLFLFDNDVDGLMSFLLLRRFCGRGKGVAIKSFPELNQTYLRKVHEFNPDYIFVLDKPKISKNFIENINTRIPIIWIDHHLLENKEESKGTIYFNPLMGEKPSSEPVSYWCYKISKKKEDEWLSMLGCLADWFMPDFAENFSKKYRDILPETKNVEKVIFETPLGKLIKILSFALKDRTTKVVRMLKYLINVKSVYDLINETPKNKAIYFRYRQVNRKFQKLVMKAKEISKLSRNKILFFQYGGDLSLSSEISNELFYLYPKKIIVVAYIKGAYANISIRSSKNIREIVMKAVEGLEGSVGGHEHACGGKLKVEELPMFKDNLSSLLKKY